MGDDEMTIERMARESYENAASKGFHDGESPPSKLDPSKLEHSNLLATKLCLIHSEVSEALECIREGTWADRLNEKGKPEGLFSELADIIIRVGDMAEMFPAGSERLADTVQQKMKYNTSRPTKHGKGF